MTQQHKIAVVGGGISGCAFARQIIEESQSSGQDVHVTIFDWGRSVGGRASHRFRPEASQDDGKMLTLHFDHGAQFLHATNSTFLEMARPAIKPWPKDSSRLGWLQSQTGKFTPTNLNGNNIDFASTGSGFFGVMDPKLNNHRYVGIGGMNAIANEMLRSAKEIAPDRITILEGTRVARCERLVKQANDNEGISSYCWKLFGDGLGHEQANVKALKESTQQVLGEYDELVITDHMAAAMPSWHPCHVVGLDDAVPELVSSLREALQWDESTRRFQSVKSLFSCMLAFDRPLGVPFDAVSIPDSDVLQWVCCQESRPHHSPEPGTEHLERWILVSTPEFAQKCLQGEGMSKASTKENIEYVPQTDEYLRSDPAKFMSEAFLAMVEIAMRNKDDTSTNVSMPKPIHEKCQRWGAAFTSCSDEKNVQKIDDILKAHEKSHSITLCGDFVHELRHRTKNVDDKQSATDSFAIQNAALSGIDAATVLLTGLKQGR